MGGYNTLMRMPIVRGRTWWCKRGVMSQSTGTGVCFRANMADIENMQDVQIEKNTKITVNVDESLPDILVVTYEYGSRIFQGVLLDSAKRNLPYGVSNLHPVYSSTSKTEANKTEDDKLYSANQRFTYIEGVSAAVSEKYHQNRSVRLPAKYKNPKMTVRLRPRQVLCSKCRGICTENSENVDASRKRKAATVEDESTRQQQVQQQKRTPITRPMITRLTRTTTCSRVVEPTENPPEPPPPPTIPPLACEERVQQPPSEPEFKEPSPRKETTTTKKRMVLRKKKSVGSMEDLWDESVFEENNANGGGVLPGVDLGQSTRTIKISFGREGEGTVLKIPAKIEDLETTKTTTLMMTTTTSDGTTTDPAIEKVRTKDARSKAARRALKKAKKEARRKILLGSGGSPCYALGGASPRYTLAGNGSPRYTIGANASPRHGLGGNSPRYAITATTPHYDNFMPRRHKHKVKHKKKHREERRSQRDSTESLTTTNVEPAAPEESYTEMKEQCLKQKLSINLKRLNASAYTTRCDTATVVDDTKSGPEEASSDEQTDTTTTVPDFPPPAQPIMMHITAQTVATGFSADGNRLNVGDVVWGKIHGFPWWPGKVLTITDGEHSPQAHVAWYGSSTSSLMPCDQLSPFLENFKIRYNKKKRGPYKEAIKQATCEAQTETLPKPQDLVPLPSPALIPPALASPREINVVS